MPSKLKPWYTYAAKVVQTIRTKSPKIVIRQRMPIDDQISAQGIQKLKIATIMMLSGLIEVTIKSKKNGTTDEVKCITEGPKYDAYILEQDNHGLKQTLEISPAQDLPHLDPRLQFNVRQVQTAIKLCMQYDKRAMDSGTVSDHS